MEYTEEEYQFIKLQSIKLEVYYSDGWRCDFCESGCTCDQNYESDLVEEVIKKFPRLSESKDQVLDKIRYW